MNDVSSSCQDGALPIEKATVQAQRHPVGDIVARLDALGRDDDVSLGRIVESFGQSSFLAVLLVPSLLVVSPLSGVPLFSSLCGICIVAIVTQILLRCDHLWLPKRLKGLHISGDNLHRATGMLRRVADWLDTHSRPRLHALVNPPMRVFALSLCALSGAVMPVLELVPFSSSLLGAMISLIAVGLLVGDGIFVASGLVFGLLASSVPILLMNAIFGP